MRYCGSKYDHKPHSWQQIGRPHGPIYTCGGKPKQVVQLTDPLQQIDFLDAPNDGAPRERPDDAVLPG